MSLQIPTLFYVESGCMYGYSLIKAFHAAKRMHIKVEFVAIDPFTGDVNMWDWEERAHNGIEFLQLQGGQPTIFQRFLANTYPLTVRVLTMIAFGQSI